MTKEEAIYYLKSSGMSDEQIKSVIDAFTCKDCIRREEALLALTGMDLPTDIDKLIALFTKRIQQLPSVTPQQTSWIPVSERLPEKEGYYLTTTMYHEVFCDYWNKERFERTETIIAWMPLPPSYQGK